MGKEDVIYVADLRNVDDTAKCEVTPFCGVRIPTSTWKKISMRVPSIGPWAYAKLGEKSVIEIRHVPEAGI